MSSNDATDGATPAIQIRGMSKSYQKGHERIRVLNGLDFVIHGGEMVSIMGPSGSGKSTLLNILAGVTPCDAGEVFLQGKALHGVAERRRTLLRALHVGFVFQFYNLIPVLSAEENIDLPLSLWRMSGRERALRREAALTAVGMQHRRRHRPGELSGGEQQRIAIARAIVGNPEVVLCDEPTGDLNRAVGAEIMEVLSELCHNYGKAIIVVTHDPSVAERADRHLELEDGALVENEPAQR